MAKFCENCGRPLEEGEVCNCTQQSETDNKNTNENLQNQINQMSDKNNKIENEKKPKKSPLRKFLHFVRNVVLAIVAIFVVLLVIGVVTDGDGAAEESTQKHQEADQEAQEEADNKETTEKSEEETSEAEKKNDEIQAYIDNSVLPVDDGDTTGYEIIANEILMKQRDRIGTNTSTNVSEDMIMEVVNNGKNLKEAGFLVDWELSEEEWLDIYRTPSSAEGKMFMALLDWSSNPFSFGYESSDNSFSYTFTPLTSEEISFVFSGEVSDVMDINGNYIENPAGYSYVLVIGQLYLNNSYVDLANPICIFVDQDEIETIEYWTSE